jgi:hypothetical protein
VLQQKKWKTPEAFGAPKRLSGLFVIPGSLFKFSGNVGKQTAEIFLGSNFAFKQKH